MPDEKTDAAARKSRRPRPPKPLTPPAWPDVGRLAHRHLGAPFAAGDLDRLVRLVADWAAVERRKRPPASKWKRELLATSAQVKALARKLREIGPGPLLADAALGDPPVAHAAAEAGAARPLATPLLDRANAMRDLEDRFNRLAAAIAAESDRIPSGKAGGASRPASLTFGLKALLEIWLRHRPEVVPDQGHSEGRFLRLAVELFGGPPCAFGADEVGYAVVDLLPRDAEARQVDPVADAVEPRRPALGAVRIIGAKSGLVTALQAALVARGAEVEIVAWSNPTPHARGAAGGDLLIMVPDEAPLVPRNVRHAPPMSEDRMMRNFVFDPLRELDRLERTAKPRLVVILMPALPIAPHHAVQAWASLYAARAALAAVIQLRSGAPGWQRSAVVAMQIGWGANIDESGLPLVPPTDDQVAATMLETLAHLGRERTGSALDLHGSTLPVLMAWPHPEVGREVARG